MSLRILVFLYITKNIYFQHIIQKVILQSPALCLSLCTVGCCCCTGAGAWLLGCADGGVPSMAGAAAATAPAATPGIGLLLTAPAAGESATLMLLLASLLSRPLVLVCWNNGTIKKINLKLFSYKIILLPFSFYQNISNIFYQNKHSCCPAYLIGHIVHIVCGQRRCFIHLVHLFV